MELVITAVICLLIGAVIGALWSAGRERGRAKADLEAFESKLADAVASSGELRTVASVAEARLDAGVKALEAANAEIQSLRDAKDATERERAALQSQLAELRARGEEQRQSLADQLATLTQARESMKTEFEALSGRIFEERAKAMNEQGAAGLEQVLKPVREKLGEFQGKVEALQSQQTKDAATLGAELKHLGDVSRGMTEEASRLTRALTTQSQVRGAWGEQVLERVLEVAGLREGIDFALQEVHRRADGTLPRPDVVVNLPQNRRIVVDAKLSLIDYVAYTAATDEAERAAALKRHVAAVRQHVRDLSGKRYQDLVGAGALDFVIAFVPIEQAYLAAVEADNDLYDDAWTRHVMFACPSTLLYALRMVSYLWTQEAQARNVEEIVRRGAELYDKFVGFTDDLAVVGAALQKAESAYEGAFSKLSKGKGNLVRQTEMLRELGVKSSKRISPALLESASPDEPALAHSSNEGLQEVAS